MITIFVDASFCPQTKAAGWGAWYKAKDQLKGITIGGRFNLSMKSSSEAELCGIANTLHHLANKGNLAEDDVVMVQSDSLRSLNLMNKYLQNTTASDHEKGAPISTGEALTHTPREAEAIAIISNITGDFKTKIYLRHVRAHNGVGDGRSWVNEQCDTIAKTHMRSARDHELRKQGKPVKKQGTRTWKKKPKKS